MIRRTTALFVACSLLAWSSAAVSAGVSGAVVRETVEWLSKKFPKEAAEEGLEALTKSVDNLAAKYGDDAIEAVRKVGPRALRLTAEAGEHADDAVKLLARRGDDAVWVVADKKRLALFAKYGDEAADGMIKHRAVAEPLIETFQKPAAAALNAVSPQNGRRLAMLAEDGTLAATRRADDVLNVIARYGDRAMQFIWNHKGALAVGSVLAAFLADPQPFLDGTRDLASVIGENAVRPLVETAASAINWTVVALAMLMLGSLMWVARSYRRHRAELRRAAS